MTPPTASHDPYAEPYGDEGDQPLVRPYAMTGGRTRPRYTARHRGPDQHHGRSGSADGTAP